MRSPLLPYEEKSQTTSWGKALKFCVVMLFIGAALWSRRTFDTGTAVGNYFDSEVPVGPAKTEGQPCKNNDEVPFKFCCGNGIVMKGVKKLTSNECRDKLEIASLKPLPNPSVGPGERCTDTNPLTDPSKTCCSEELKIVVNGKPRTPSSYCEASPLHVLRTLAEKAPELVNVFQHCAAQEKFATGEGAFKKLYTDDFSGDFNDEKLKTFLGITGAKKLDARFKDWKWEAEKKGAFNKAYFRIRHFVVYCFVNLMIEAVQAGGLQAVISAPGSADPTSDIDVSISGSGAIVVLEGYYKIFDEYAKQKSKPMGLSLQTPENSISSMEKFDANLYCGNYLISIPGDQECRDFSPLYVEVGTKSKDGKTEKNCILKDIFFESAYVDELGVAFAKLDYFLGGLSVRDQYHAYAKENLKVLESLNTFVAKGYKYAANAAQKVITKDSLTKSFTKWQKDVKDSKVKIIRKSFAEGNHYTQQDNKYKARMAIYQKATNAADTAPPAAAAENENVFKSWHENAIWLAMTAQESYFSRGPFLAVVVGDQLRGGATTFDDKIIGRNMRVDDFMTAVIENLADLIKDFGHYTDPGLAGAKEDKLVKFFAKGSKYAYRFLESASALNYYYGDKLTEQSAPHWYVQDGVLTEPERKKVMSALLVVYGVRWFCRDDPVGNCGGSMGCWNADKIAAIVPNFMKMIIEVYKRVILRSKTQDGTQAIADLDLTGFLSPPCMSPDKPNKFLGTIVHGVNRVAVRTCLTGGTKELAGEDLNVNCIFNNGRHIKRVLPVTTGLKLRKEMGGCDKNLLQDLPQKQCDALSFKPEAIRIKGGHCTVGNGQQTRPICKTGFEPLTVDWSSDGMPINSKDALNSRTDKTGKTNGVESTGKTNGVENSVQKHLRVEKSVKLDLH